MRHSRSWPRGVCLIWLTAFLMVLPSRGRSTVVRLRPASEEVQRGLLQASARRCPSFHHLDPQLPEKHHTRVAGDTLRICALRVEFVSEAPDDPNSTGDGTFDLGTGGGPFSPPPHDKAYFERNLTALSRYYHVQSRGRLTLEHEVFPRDSVAAYRVSKQLSYYSPPEYDVWQKVNRLLLFISEALDSADVDTAVVFSEFDCFVVFHAGADYQHDVYWDTPSDMVTGHATLSPPHVVDAGTDSFLIDYVTVVPEQIEQDGLVGSILSSLAHEFGHELGLPDMYLPNFWPGVGYWALMDNGDSVPLGFETDEGDILTVMGVLPPSMCAWSRARLGWEDVVEPPEGTHGVQAVGADGVGARVCRFALGEKEHFLVENRQVDLDGDPMLYLKLEEGVVMGPSDSMGELTQEYDAGLPGGGILIWHIDEKLFDPDADAFANTYEWDPVWQKYVFLRGVALEEADGVQDIGSVNSLYDSRYPGGAYVPEDWKGEAQDAWFAGNADEFGPSTEPKTMANDGRVTHLRISEIGASGTAMTFTVSRDWDQRGWPVEGSGSPAVAGGMVACISPTGAVRMWDGSGNGLGADGDPVVADLGEGVDEPGTLWQDDGVWVMVVATNSQRLHCLEVPAGSERAGFPIELDGRPVGPVAVGDLDGDATGEAVVATASGTVWAVELNSGQVPEEWPSVLTQGTVVGGVALADVADGGGAEVVVPTTAGKLHLLDYTATEVDGWPAEFEYRGGKPLPAVADLDKDEELELVLASGTKLWVLGPDGLARDGWPVELDTPASSEVSLGDVGGDGYLDILVLTEGAWVHCLDGRGLPRLDWPVGVAGSEDEITSGTAPLLGDVDGDGLAEVVAVARGKAWAFRADGEAVRGWPLGSESGLTGTGALDDVDSDGDVELLWASAGQVMVWDLAGEPADSLDWWGQYRGGSAHTGHIDRWSEPPLAPAFLERSVFVWPNPARETRAWISYELGEARTVQFRAFDAAGSLVAEWEEAGCRGRNESEWDLADVPSGVYVIRVKAGSAGQRWIKAAVVK